MVLGRYLIVGYLDPQGMLYIYTPRSKDRNPLEVQAYTKPVHGPFRSAPRIETHCLLCEDLDHEGAKCISQAKSSLVSRP